jgi:hypothetical protein
MINGIYIEFMNILIIGTIISVFAVLINAIEYLIINVRNTILISKILV